MFMGKTEWNYVKLHLKMRRKESRGIYVIGILLGIYFLNDVIGMIHMVYKYQIEASLYKSAVYSDLALVFIVIACIYYAITYDEYNERHQIFPHTASTQLISYELNLWLLNAVLQLLALFLYLLQYLNCNILEHLKGNVEFAYQFDPHFLTTGFFVNLFYGFLIISFITLITSLIRKFSWWTLIPFFALWLSLWIMRNPKNTVDWVNFYLKNSSPAIFLLKAFVTLIITEGLNFTINRHTNQFKAIRFKSRYSIITTIFATILCLNFFIGYCRINSEDYAQRKPWQPLQSIDTTTDKPIYELDAGNLPVDSQLQVNIDYPLKTTYNINIGGGELNRVNDMIDIYYYPQQEMNTSVNLTAFTNPHIEASLTDNVLSILVAYDKNIKVVSLYPYSTLMQFDCFKNKPYAKRYFGRTYSTMPGTIIVSLPENKNFHTNWSN